MTVLHRPGIKHGNANGLSRIPDEYDFCDCYTAGSELSTLPCGGCRYCSRAQQQWSRFDEDVDYVVPLTVKSATVKSTVGRSSPWITGYSHDQLVESQRSDPCLGKLITWLSTGGEPMQKDLFLCSPTVKYFFNCRKWLVCQNGFLLYKWEEVSGDRLLLMVPEKLKNKVISYNHDLPLTGHMGIVKTIARVKQSFMWYGLTKDVELYVKSCSFCNKNKRASVKAKAALGQYHAGSPMERVHVDILGPFTPSSQDNQYVLMLVDQFIKWLECYPLPDQTAYELVPEAYRQKFRNYRKQESQTHVEFAHEKEVYFDRWCNSREVGTDFEKLRQVILIEEFKRCVRDDIKTYLDEQKVENLAKAAAYADDYALTHKSTFNKNKSFGPAKKSYPEIGKKSENVAPEKSSDKGQTSNQTMSKDRKPRSFAPVCHYCKKPGHVMSDCWLLKKRREKEATPNAFVSSKSNWRSNPNRTESSIGLDKSEIIREEFKPFVSAGFVSLESSSSQVPIKILRDTGATQSLLLEGVLPLSVSTSTGESVIAQGIEGGCVNVPLHKVKLVSDLVTGSVVVGTRPTLPIKGVSLLLGNDLAGGKVVADPKVTSKSITLVSTEKLEEVIPGIFPSCAVTRAMAKKAQEEPKDCKQSTEVLVDLSDTFLNNYDHDVQNSSDTNPKVRVDSEKQDSIDCRDVSLSKSKLISEQENDPELAPLFKLVLPPVELDKIPVGYSVRNGVLM